MICNILLRDSELIYILVYLIFFLKFQPVHQLKENLKTWKLKLKLKYNEFE